MRGYPPYTDSNQKKLPSLDDFEVSPPQQRNNVDNNNNNINNNNVKNPVSDTYTQERSFPPCCTEAAFNTTNFPRFYSSAIHLSPIILVFSGLLGVVSYSVTE